MLQNASILDALCVDRNRLSRLESARKQVLAESCDGKPRQRAAVVARCVPQARRGACHICLRREQHDGAGEDRLLGKRRSCVARKGWQALVIVGVLETERDDRQGLGVTPTPPTLRELTNERARWMRIGRGVAAFGHASE